MSGKLLLIYICNFHVLSHLLLIYICKLHWNWRKKKPEVDEEEVRKKEEEEKEKLLAENEADNDDALAKKYASLNMSPYELALFIQEQVNYFWFTYEISMS